MATFKERFGNKRVAIVAGGALALMAVGLAGGSYDKAGLEQTPGVEYSQTILDTERDEIKEKIGMEVAQV